MTKSDLGVVALGAVALVTVSAGLIAGTAERSTNCAFRPVNAKVESCLRIDPVTHKQVDFGAENVMQPGEWVGSGCVELKCPNLTGEE